jgi:hypothetical protein
VKFSNRRRGMAIPFLALLVSGCSGGGAAPTGPTPIVPAVSATATPANAAPSAAQGGPVPTAAATASPAPQKTPTPAASAVPPPQPAIASAAPTVLRFGAYVHPDPSASPGLSSVATFETALGRKLDLDLHYYPITYAYPGAALLDDAANGRTPIISLKCGIYTNADIAAGVADAALDKMASELKAFGQPVYVRYLWEMNSSLSSTGRTACAGPDDTNGYFNATDFVAAWDHMRARFIADGATNVKWYWCPNDDAATLGPYFPGRSEVDYFGVDVYDRPTESFKWFQTHFRATYTSIVDLAPGLPFIVGETAGTTSSGQIAYFNSLPSFYATMPSIRAWVYFDAVGQLDDWRVQPSTPQFAALQQLVNPG